MQKLYPGRDLIGLHATAGVPHSLRSSKLHGGHEPEGKEGREPQGEENQRGNLGVTKRDGGKAPGQTAPKHHCGLES